MKKKNRSVRMEVERHIADGRILTTDLLDAISICIYRCSYGNPSNVENMKRRMRHLSRQVANLSRSIDRGQQDGKSDECSPGSDCQEEGAS